MVLKRIKPEEARLGMFIHGFDGPWIDHPFWRSRFHLTKPADLVRLLESGVEYLTIDQDRELPPVNLASDQRPLNVLRAVATTRKLASSNVEQCDDANERRTAAKLVRQSVRDLRRMFAAAHDDAELSIDHFAPIVEQIVGSIERNRFALIAVTRLKSRDEYTYVHSLAVSALLASFARTLGMDDQDVHDLALAGLLHDIGKVVVPNKVLQKDGPLSSAEFAVVRTHAEQGHSLLKRDPGASSVLLDVCLYHHERMDGSGYPAKLTGEAISRPARMAAICDVYDALTSNRPYKAAWSAQESIDRMRSWSGHFDPDLLSSFMKVVGVYPPGLLLRLRSNRLAVSLPRRKGSNAQFARVFCSSRSCEPLTLHDVELRDALNFDQVVSEEYPLDWGLTDWPMLSEQVLNGMAPKLPTNFDRREQADLDPALDRNFVPAKTRVSFRAVG